MTEARTSVAIAVASTVLKKGLNPLEAATLASSLVRFKRTARITALATHLYP
jgi:hypothetical protein